MAETTAHASIDINLSGSPISDNLGNLDKLVNAIENLDKRISTLSKERSNIVTQQSRVGLTDAQWKKATAQRDEQSVEMQSKKFANEYASAIRELSQRHKKVMKSEDDLWKEYENNNIAQEKALNRKSLQQIKDREKDIDTEIKLEKQLAKKNESINKEKEKIEIQKFKEIRDYINAKEKQDEKDFDKNQRIQGKYRGGDGNSPISGVINSAILGTMVGGIASGIAQYAKASNVLIGANLYDRQLREAQESIQRNTVVKSGLGSVIGGAIGGIAGSLILPGVGTVGGIGVGAYAGNKISSIFSSKENAYTNLEANIVRQQQTLSRLTGDKLVDYTNLDSGNTFKATKTFSDMARTHGMDYAMSYASAQHGALLNTTGTAGIGVNLSSQLAKSVSDEFGKNLMPDQLQTISSSLSGLFAHSPMANNIIEMNKYIRDMSNNAKRLGVNPADYIQQVYARQQYMGGSINSAMGFTDMALNQGWRYANTITQMQQAPIMQRLAGTMALKMAGYSGDYNDALRNPSIINKLAGNKTDPYNLKGAILQNAGFDLWGLSSGSGNNRSMDKNTTSIDKLTEAMNTLNMTLLNATSTNLNGMYAMGQATSQQTQSAILNNPLAKATQSFNEFQESLTQAFHPKRITN